MNKIQNYTVKKLEYKNPLNFFNNLDKGYMPSFLTGEGPKDISTETYIGLKPVKRVKLENIKTLWEDLRILNNSVDFHKYIYPVNRIGAIGYISYEALHSIENIKKMTIDCYNIPFAEWIIYSEYYYFNNNSKELFQINLEYKNSTKLKGNSSATGNFEVKNLKADFTKEEYISNVNKIITEIINGEVYEVNLTQGINGDFKGSTYSLFKKLFSSNKSPYSAYLERDDFSVISNSPELFLKADKNIVETRPIKGTAPRGNTDSEDLKLQNELFISEKNQAELFMIVDLMRNDLSKVCKIGSVNVKEKKRIEHYKNVHHLVSVITGELKSNRDYIDLFKATFPGGSITGCPKVKCMELTEEIEKTSRNLYTGTIFIMNKELLNCSIVIRSAIIKDNKIFLNSGGAITIDSDANEEYEETLVKLDSLFKAVNYDKYL